MKSLFGWLPVALCCILAAGCGEEEKLPPGVVDVSGAKVQGRLMSGGQPLQMLQDEEIQVTFFESGKDPMSGRVESMSVVEQDGSFTIHGPTNKGIPPGTYRVAVRSEIYSGDGENRFEDAFSVDTTPLEVAVGTEENQVFVIDLSTRSVTKE